MYLHCLVLDGIYRRTEHGPVFQEARTPSTEALHALLVKIILRIMKLLTRQGHLIGRRELPGRHRCRSGAHAPASGLLHLPHCPWAARRTEGAELASRA